jgi:hypothetical protein
MLPQIFYGDGSIMTEPPYESRGVIAIVQYHDEVGAEIIANKDYYVYENHKWKGVDIFGFYDYLMDSGIRWVKNEPTIVLFGRAISDEEYYKVMTKALEVKNGWLPREHK